MPAFRPIQITVAVAVAAFALPLPLCQAQERSARVSDSAAMLSALEALHYDPMQRGPLIVGLPPAPSHSHPINLAGATTLPVIAEVTGMRLVSAGQVRVLVPRTMTTIAAGPGKANPCSQNRTAIPQTFAPLSPICFAASPQRRVWTFARIGEWESLRSFHGETMPVPAIF